MAFQAMWVHGHSANIELNNRGRGPGEDIDGIGWSAVEGLRISEGVRYRCQENSDYWFHFAIPTPVLFGGGRAKLRRVMVLFTADEAAQLEWLRVFDGPNPVFDRHDINVSGPNLDLIDGRNAFYIENSREVRWGIGVSVMFHFVDTGNVILHSAGVDFET